MTKKEFKAFAVGYDMAIFRSEEICPYNKQSDLKFAWANGKKAGEETLKFHRGNLRRYATALENLSGHARRDYSLG